MLYFIVHVLPYIVFSIPAIVGVVKLIVAIFITTNLERKSSFIMLCLMNIIPFFILTAVLICVWIGMSPLIY
jgi:hypothetical protein